MRALGLSLTIYCLNILTGTPLAAASNAAQPNREEVLDQARELVNSDRIGEAEALLEGVRTQAVKENNPLVEAVILNNLGSVYDREAKYPEAERSYDRAILLFARVKGENAPDLVEPLSNLAALLYESSQFSRAENLLLREIAVLNAVGKPDGKIASALAFLGKVYLFERKYALAEHAAEESLKVYAREGESDGLGAAFGYTILGAVSTQYGAISGAEESLRQALSILETALKPDDPRVGEGIANLGMLYMAAGAIDKAEPLLEQAHERLEASGANSLFRRGFLLDYANFERKSGHKKKAKELTREAELLTARSPENSLSRYVVDASRYRQ